MCCLCHLFLWCCVSSVSLLPLSLSVLTGVDVFWRSVFPAVHSAEWVAETRALLEPEFQRHFELESDGPFFQGAEGSGRVAVAPGLQAFEGSAFGQRLMESIVCHPMVLDFAQLVMGPFVQLDNLTLAAMAPVPDPEDARGKAGGWHRDRWGRMPNGAYERPLAFNAITYLQDLTDDNVRSAPFPCPTLNLATLTRRQPLRSLRCVPLAHATSAGCVRRAHCASCPGATCSPLSWDRRKARPRIATSRSST